jgi:hypothetical protein
VINVTPLFELTLYFYFFSEINAQKIPGITTYEKSMKKSKAKCVLLGVNQKIKQ